MKSCATCAHWLQPENNKYGEIPGCGTCKYIPLFHDAAEWDEEFEGRVLLEKYKDRLAFAADASGYSGVLRTMPQFGCVHHKDKAC